MRDCPFCAIAAGQLEASIVAENDSAIAFMDLRQAQPGHVLVIPRAHVETVLDIDPALAAQVMALAVHVAHAVDAVFQPDGMNLWQSNGEAGGQEVPHFHLHVHPRNLGDGLLGLYPHGVPSPAARDALDMMAARLRNAIEQE